MTKAKHRRGEVASPEIVALADTVAGVLAIIFSVDKTALLERPRPSGKLRSVRDVLMGILHHRLGVSQQKIAAALERDRGVVSDAAHALDEAAEGDEGVRFALAAITEKISELMAMAETWNEALDQSNLDRAIKAAAFKRATEEEDDDELEHDITIEELAAAPAAKTRCHQCYGKKTIRIHRLGGDPAYRDAWAAAEAKAPSGDGFHTLDCRFCKGLGYRASPAALSDSAILSRSTRS